jgi:hypothetical protein
MVVDVRHIRKKPMYKDIVRFWQCLFPRSLDDKALSIIKKVLDDNEYRVFSSMYVIDQIHGYEVYTEMLKYAAANNLDIAPVLGKAILLHDVGKNYLGISVLDRVIVGIFNKLPAGMREKLLKALILKPFALAYNKNAQHPEAGAQILEKNNIAPDIIRLVRHHHDRDVCYKELGTEGQLIYAIDNYF